MSAKTYVATFMFGLNETFMQGNFAFSFESFTEAKDYILRAIEQIKPFVSDFHAGGVSVSWNEKDWCHFSICIGTGIAPPMDALITEHPSGAVKFDLLYFKNGKLIETHRYSKRELAMNHAHEILDDLGYEAEDREDALGHWRVNSTNLDVRILLELVTLGQPQNEEEKEKEKRACCKFFGVRANASLDKIKQAYEEQIYKYYSDCQMDMLQTVQSEYKRLLEATSKSGREVLGVDASTDVIDSSLFLQAIHERLEVAAMLAMPPRRLDEMF